MSLPFGAARGSEPIIAPVAAWITVDPSGVGQRFTGHVRSGASFTGRYELHAERSGASGRTSTRQGGALQVEADEPLQLSSASLSPLGPADHYSVVLVIYEGDAEVARAEQRR